MVGNGRAKVQSRMELDGNEGLKAPESDWSQLHLCKSRATPLMSLLIYTSVSQLTIGLGL